jgi:3-methyladenine DNA glycosylase/8-oxoguanine DNA glycosylase
VSASDAAAVTREVSSPRPLDAATTLRIIGRGPRDHAVRLDGRLLWYVARTPDGGVTCLIEQVDEHRVSVQLWGLGAEWQAEHVRELLGDTDGATELPHLHDVVRMAHRRFPGLRVPRTRRVFDAIVPAVLEQKVVGVDALASRRRLLAWLGEPAPGPAPEGMLVPPIPREWELLPSWQWHRAGVDPNRSRAIMRAAAHAARLEETVQMDRSAAYARLQAVPGIGPWTAAETAKVALGDTDAVSVGDYHLGRFVVWALTGAMDGDDEQMLELLEPYRPMRQLVIRLLELTVSMPRRGPRASRVDHRRH